MKGRARQFRTAESLDEEAITREAIGPFLSARGYDVLEDRRTKSGIAVSQFIRAQSVDGASLQMRVRLCWRRSGERLNKGKYSAAQLSAKLREDSWDATLEYVIDRDREEGNTHHLIVQRDGNNIVYAALIPREALGGIWRAQRDTSAGLIAGGHCGRQTKNHSMNGSSPTIWLEDDRWPRSHEIADVLWNWPGVIDIARKSLLSTHAQSDADDTFDDCPAGAAWDLGSDGAARRQITRSEVRRDPKVRRAVARRSSVCERQGCGVTQRYPGFFDVHHILGAENSDRVWNCVVLCPNCHRDAHYSPDAEEINLRLLEYAEQFQLPKPNS